MLRAALGETRWTVIAFMKLSVDTPPGEARRAIGGEDVARPGEIVAEGLGGMMPGEDRPGAGYARNERLGLVGGEA